MNKLAVVVIAMLCPLATASAQPQANTSTDRERLIGAWHLVKIASGASDEDASSTSQPLGILIYTRDGHMSVQLMYPKAAHAPDNEYVRAGYEASFGSYDIDEAKHTLTHHVMGSITRDLLVGRSLSRIYQLTQDGRLIIRSADQHEHWSVTWEHD